MSLDLDADVLITEIAPIPALIQRLGRLNRRVTPEEPGSPRTAAFYAPKSALPYDDESLKLAECWVDELIGLNRPLSQATLSRYFDTLAHEDEIELDTRTGWLDSGWLATPEHVREPGCSVSVIIPGRSEEMPGKRGRGGEESHSDELRRREDG